MINNKVSDVQVTFQGSVPNYHNSSAPNTNYHLLVNYIVFKRSRPRSTNSNNPDVDVYWNNATLPDGTDISGIISYLNSDKIYDEGYDHALSRYRERVSCDARVTYEKKLFKVPITYYGLDKKEELATVLNLTINYGVYKILESRQDLCIYEVEDLVFDDNRKVDHYEVIDSVAAKFEEYLTSKRSVDDTKEFIDWANDLFNDGFFKKKNGKEVAHG